MNTETYVRKVLDEWSAEARVPPGLADRALGRRRAGRRITKAVLVAAAVMALIVVAGVTVGVQVGPHPTTARPRPTDTSLRTDPNDAPPQRLVAAGQVAVSAYYVGHGDPRKFTRTWYLYNTSTGTYQKVPWGWVDVAPGLRQAAVLDGPLPTTRLGFINMKTHRVTRWITLRAAAGGLAWSPDGRRLLVTTYARNPDAMGAPGTGARTGFIVVDAKTGEAHFHSLLYDPENPNTRQDFNWSRDGKLIWAPRLQVPSKVFYDLNGAQRPAPPHEDQTLQQAGLSPNGRYLATEGTPPGPQTAVTDVTTGRKVATQPVEQLLAWADDTHLIAKGCDPKQCRGKGEFHNRLLLVSVDGKTIIPLTGYRNGGWVPLFTHR
ncbi:hypothetical protein GCM10023191_063970 [Actinoallomurus oryzae]|uniref:WD40 repeat domain-containing protein n=1 Tax=Actinoallomurus oryzae TaxID=502180 RepID=A0ABP8QN99_9ACTN